MQLNELLRLERPLVIFDLETTGLDPNRDRIIQLAMTMHYPAPKEAIAFSTLVNPEMPIRNQGSHHITDADVKDAPKFKDLAPDIAKKVLDVDLAGHNAGNFDIKFMFAEMRRAGVPWDWKGHMVDTLAICRIKTPHTLANAYKRFVNIEGFKGAHDAGNDVEACGAVLAGQLKEFSDLPRTVKELAEFCLNRPTNAVDKEGKLVWNDKGEACLTFGKWKGTPLHRVDPSYIVWAINNANFPDDVVVIFGNALKKIYPSKEPPQQVPLTEQPF